MLIIVNQYNSMFHGQIIRIFIIGERAAVNTI